MARPGASRLPRRIGRLAVAGVVAGVHVGSVALGAWMAFWVFVVAAVALGAWFVTGYREAGAEA
ncbi:MAG: hypothetical protein ABEJ73_12910 [Haloplanus sp.]